jgi:hypothetical protein
MLLKFNPEWLRACNRMPVVDSSRGPLAIGAAGAVKAHPFARAKNAPDAAAAVGRLAAWAAGGERGGGRGRRGAVTVAGGKGFGNGE